MPKLLLFFLSFLFYFFSYERDYLLSDKLHKDYKKLIMKTSIGREFYKRKFNKIERPLIVLRYSDDIGYAWYDPYKNIITLNTKYIMIFFNIDGYDDEKIINVFYFSDKTRKEFVNYSDTIFFHELIHAYQSKVYPSVVDYNNNFFIEFEYEAYFLSDIYFFEKMKNNKKLFLKILANQYIDLYTSDAVNGFFSMITNIDEYKSFIKKRYQNEITGYVSLTDEERKRKAVIEEKKLISYAIGKREIVYEEEKKLDEIEKIKTAYHNSVVDFYNKRYHAISCDAIAYIIENSALIDNYYLLFKAGYYFKKNRCNRSFEKILALLMEFEKKFRLWIGKHKNKISFQDLYLTLRSYDDYLSILGKDFPVEISKLKEDVYLRRVAEIKEKLNTITDENEKEEYIKELDFLYQKLGKDRLKTLF